MYPSQRPLTRSNMDGIRYTRIRKSSQKPQRTSVYNTQRNFTQKDAYPTQFQKKKRSANDDSFQKNVFALRSFTKALIYLVCIVLLVLTLTYFKSDPLGEPSNASHPQIFSGVYFPNQKDDAVQVQKKKEVNRSFSKKRRSFELKEEEMTEYDRQERRDKEFYENFFGQEAQEKTKRQEEIQKIRENYKLYGDDYVFVDCWGNVISKEYFESLGENDDLGFSCNKEGSYGRFRKEAIVKEKTSSTNKLKLSFLGKLKRDFLLLFYAENELGDMEVYGKGSGQVSFLGKAIRSVWGLIKYIVRKFMNFLANVFYWGPKRIFESILSFFSKQKKENINNNEQQGLTNDENIDEENQEEKTKESQIPDIKKSKYKSDLEQFQNTIPGYLRATSEDLRKSGLVMDSWQKGQKFPSFRELMNQRELFDPENKLEEWFDDGRKTSRTIQDFRVPAEEEMLKVIAEALLNEDFNGDEETYAKVQEARKRAFEYLNQHHNLQLEDEDIRGINDGLKGLLEERSHLNVEKMEKETRSKNREEERIRLEKKLEDLNSKIVKEEEEYQGGKGREVSQLNLEIKQKKEAIRILREKMKPLDSSVQSMSNSVSNSRHLHSENEDIRQLKIELKSLDDEWNVTKKEREGVKHNLEFTRKRLHFLKFQLEKYQKHREMYLFVEKIRVQNQKRGTSLKEIKENADGKMELIKEYLMNMENFQVEEEDEWEIDESVLREILEDSKEGEDIFEEVLNSLRDSFQKILEKSGDWNLEEYDRKIEELHTRVQKVEEKQNRLQEEFEEYEARISVNASRREEIAKEIEQIKRELGIWGEIEEKKVELGSLEKEMERVQTEIKESEGKIGQVLEKVTQGIEEKKKRRDQMRKKLAKERRLRTDDGGIQVRLEQIQGRLDKLNPIISQREQKIQKKIQKFKKKNEIALEKRREIIDSLKNIF